MTKDNWRENATNTSQFAAPLAAGTYLIGDPCYAFSNDAPGDLWGEWLADAWKDVDPNRVTILDGRVRGMRIIASSTAHGDGEYADQFDRSYPVDAGLLGAVHVGFLANLYPEAGSLEGDALAEWAAKQGLHVEEFPHPFHIGIEDSVVSIGHVSINTDWDDEDDEDPWS